MELISHRGNIDGKSVYENEPNYILSAINEFNVEIDVWYVDNNLYLGHDMPQYKIKLDFLLSRKNKIFAHAKNIDSLYFLLKHNIHCFWHQNDNYTLTSKNFIWVYPGQQLIKNCIAVLPDNLYTINQLKICYGICSDFIYKYSYLSK